MPCHCHGNNIKGLPTPSVSKGSLAGLLKIKVAIKYLAPKEALPLLSLPIFGRQSLGASVEMQIAQYGG